MGGVGEMKVAVFGLGSVGTVTAACLADMGHDVWAVDVNVARVAAVSDGVSPEAEPGLDELLQRSVDSGRLHATTETSSAISEAEVVLICVGTPSSPNWSIDLSQLDRTMNAIARQLPAVAPPPSGHRSIVLRSTVPPGTVDTFVGTRLRALPASLPCGHGYGMCPEFLREGSRISDFLAPPLLVVGTADRRVSGAVGELFSFVDRPLRIVDVRTAEALKYACSAFHATKVSFTNELARLFQALQVDARAVMELFCEDTTLNLSSSYLRPGFAFGGSRLPKDVRSLAYLARTHAVDLPLLTGTLASNESAVTAVVDQVVASDAHVVALLGLSCKTHANDLRGSPNVTLAETLIGKGFDVRVYDPLAGQSSWIRSSRASIDAKLPHVGRLLVDSPTTALDGADLALVASTTREVVEALLSNPPAQILDLTGGLGPAVESLVGYAGVCW
jgi:GDP-mannose 6-dehydrogenase